MIAYISTQGAKIEREGTRLIVVAPDLRHTLFIHKLEQILLFGNVSLTPPAMHLIMREQVDTVFLRLDGRYMGRLVTDDVQNTFLRKKQFLLTDDAHFCLSIAQKIVHAKICNQATLLARIKRTRQKELAGKAAHDLRGYAQTALACSSLDTLRGIEGSAAALYFKHYRLGFTEDWGFSRRVRRPPTDPVNALLSLLYTILINRCYAAVRQVGLDPQAGVLHSLAYGRNALPLDLVEEFRTPLADALTLSLFNMRMLDWQDFHTPKPLIVDTPDIAHDAQEALYQKVLHDPLGAMHAQAAPETLSDLQGEQMPQDTLAASPDAKAFYLTPSALKKVLIAMARKMETLITHPIAEREMTYNEALVFQARLYKRVVEGEAATYTPLMLR